MVFLRKLLKDTGIIGFIILQSIVSCPSLWAQGTMKPFQQATIDTGATMHGAFLQDSDGFLWFGALNGLHRYDGYELKTYQAGPSSVSGLMISAILEDHDGIIWIGTFSQGITSYDKTTETWTHHKHDQDNPNSLSSNNISFNTQKLFVDRSNILWIGTDGGGLNEYDKTTETWTHYEHDPGNMNSLSDNSITAIIEDRNGILWIGTKGGLNRFDKRTETWTRYQRKSSDNHSLNDNWINSIIEDKNGILWIGTQKGGLNRFDQKTETFIHYTYDPDDPNSLAHNNVWNIYEDQSGDLWICHINANVGLEKFDTKKNIFTHYVHNPDDPNSISSNGVVNVYEQLQTGIFWVINSNGKIDKHDKNTQKFNLWQHDPKNANSLSSNIIVPILEDSNGMIWIGTEQGGLNKFDRTTRNFTRYFPDPDDPFSLPEMNLSALFEDSEKNFWVGSWRGILTLFDRETGKSIKHYKNDPDIPDSLTKSQRIFAITEDKNNADLLWLGTVGGGLEKFDKRKESFTHYKHDPQSSNTLSHDIVVSIHDDGQGTLWIATYGGGLNRFDKKNETFKHYTHLPNNLNSLSSDTLYEVYEDASGGLWITGKGGISKFDKKTENFKNYTQENGLASNIISSLTEDTEGNLWLGSVDAGLIKFDPRTETTQVYTKNDGLQGNTFLVRSSLTTKDGEIWFGGSKGANSFYPQQIVSNPYVPPVVLTAFQQGGENINLGKAPEKIREITLDWQENYFEFQFAALNYSRPTENQYAYMLGGRDKEWYYSGSNPFGRYTGLPGGTYTLRLKGSNNDGVWNEEGTSIKITVTSPFWEKWWFYLALVTIVLGIIGFLYHFQLQAKTNQLKAEAAEASNRAKSQFLANMSHEIRTPMNAILGFSEIMKNKIDDPKLAHYLESIHSSGKSLLNLIDDILDLSKVEAGKLKLEHTPVSPIRLFDEMSVLFGQKIKDKGLEFIIEVSPDLPKTLLLDEVRLRQILINLIGNAVKFTESGYIKLSANYRYPDDTNHSTLDLIFAVEDTGKGIPDDQKQAIFESFTQVKGQKASEFGGTGLGLAITKRLIEMFNGEISVESTIDQGSTFHILLKDVEVASLSALEAQQQKHIDFHSIQFENSIILIADDIDFNRDLIKGFLQDYNFTLIEAENGKEAIEMAKEHHPQLILLDMKMPVMDGYETATIFRKEGDLNTIPIIVVSASVMKQDEKAIHPLCDAYLKKPVNKTDLILEIMKFLPHTIVKEDIEVSENSIADPSLELSPETLEKLPDLLEILRIKQRDCIELSKRNVIHEIASFAKEIEKLGKTYHYPPLIQWGEELSSAVSIFDIEKIKLYLLDFETLVFNLETNTATTP